MLFLEGTLAYLIWIAGIKTSVESGALWQHAFCNMHFAWCRDLRAVWKIVRLTVLIKNAQRKNLTVPRMFYESFRYGSLTARKYCF
jgi:hypothetical protein